MSSLPGSFTICFVDTGGVIQGAPALHSLTPKFVLQSCLTERGFGALQNVPVLSFYNAVGLGPVVGTRVVPPFEALGRLHQLLRIVGVEELWIAGACEVAERCSCRVGIFRRHRARKRGVVDLRLYPVIRSGTVN